LNICSIDEEGRYGGPQRRTIEVAKEIKKGVIVHIHDIFTPRNYPYSWLVEEVKFWNEQYLVESFLTHNKDWEIIGALNYLSHNYYNELKIISPYIDSNTEPGSLYIKKII